MPLVDSSPLADAAALDMLDYVQIMEERGGFMPVIKGGRHYHERHEWFFVCPACGFNTLHVNAQTGLYRCYSNCQGVAGHAKQFLPRDVQPRPPTALPDPPEKDWAALRRVYGWLREHLSLSAAHRRYLEGRGLDPALIEARSITRDVYRLAQAFSTEDLAQAGVVREDRWHFAFMPGRLMVPYLEEGEPVYVRTGCPTATEAWRRKLVGPYGVPASQFLYGVGRLATVPKKLMVTEGEFKAVAAWQAGFPCIATPGIGTAHDRLVAYLASGVEAVWFCYDRELPKPNARGQSVEIARATVRRLVDRLRFVRVHGRPLQIRVVELPLADDSSDPTRKTDIDAYILRDGAAAFRARVRAARTVEAYLTETPRPARSRPCMTEPTDSRSLVSCTST